MEGFVPFDKDKSSNKISKMVEEMLGEVQSDAEAKDHCMADSASFFLESMDGFNKILSEDDKKMLWQTYQHAWKHGWQRGANKAGESWHEHIHIYLDEKTLISRSRFFIVSIFAFIGFGAILYGVFILLNFLFHMINK